MSDVAALEAVVIRQRQRETRRWQFLMIFIVLIGCSILFDIATGPSLLSVSDVAHALFQPGSAEPMTKTIVYEMRLPIALMALVVGAALGLGGVQMQTLLDNPLARYILHSLYLLWMVRCTEFFHVRCSCTRSSRNTATPA